MSDISKIDMKRIEGLISRLEEVTEKINSMTYITEYVEGSNSSWYRKWSNGWMEQSFMIYSNSDSAQTFSFPYPFTTKCCTVLISGYTDVIQQSALGYAWTGQQIYSVTPNGFTMDRTDGVNGTCNCLIYACGY